PDRSAAIMRLRHGLDGGKPNTLEEIGILFGLTRERIRQLERLAIEQMQEYLTGDWDGTTAGSERLLGATQETSSKPWQPTRLSGSVRRGGPGRKEHRLTG